MFDILSQKRCSKCGEVKSVSEFHPKSGRKNQWQPYCKECFRAYTREHYKNNKESYAEKSKKYQKLHPDKTRASVSKWYYSNVEKVKEYNKKYSALKADLKSKITKAFHENNPEYRKKYYESHKSDYAAYDRNRRARKLNNGGKITNKEWASVLAKYGNKCIYPGCANTDVTMDHVIPLALGGSHSIDNVQPLCLFHNLQKFTKVVDYRVLYDV